MFSDHGFRMDAEGRSYCHGGDSTLERLVPVMTLRVQDSGDPVDE